MVVDDLDVMGVALLPGEADAPLVVDANTVLSFAVAVQSLKAVSGRRAQIHQGDRRVEHHEFSQGGALDIVGQLLCPLAEEQRLRLFIGKAGNHLNDSNVSR